jgi:hypothetical protein
MGSCSVEREGGEGSAAVSGSSIVLSGCALAVTGDRPPVFESSLGDSGRFELIIRYHFPSPKESENLSFLNESFLHVGHLEMPESQVPAWRLCVSGGRFEYCDAEGLRPIRSIIVGLDGDENVSFRLFNQNISHDMADADGRTQFCVNSPYPFIPHISCPQSVTTYYFDDSPPFMSTGRETWWTVTGSTVVKSVVFLVSLKEPGNSVALVITALSINDIAVFSAYPVPIPHPLLDEVT